MKRLGRYTLLFERRPAILGHAAVCGKKEAAGPLARDFDQTFLDSYLNQAPLLFFKHFSLYITYLFNRDDRLICHNNCVFIFINFLYTTRTGNICSPIFLSIWYKIRDLNHLLCTDRFSDQI